MRGSVFAAAAAGILAGLALLPSPGAAQMDSPASGEDRAYLAAMSLPAAEQRMIEHKVAVAPYIHMLTAPATSGPAPLANEVVIEQSDGLVLVDAGKTRGAGKRIVALIRSISPKPVKAVIITHWHQDHVMGLGPIVEAWPNARIIASVRTRDHILNDDSYRGVPCALADSAERDRSRAAALTGYARQFAASLHDPALSAEERSGWAETLGVLALRIADEKGTYLVPPGVTFDSRFAIDDPVAPVEARFIGPGHTDGDIIVWMPKQKVIAAGDMVVAPIPYGSTDVLAWPETLGRLRDLGPDIVIPGHGPVERGTDYVERLIALLVRIRGEAQRLAAQPKLSDDQVQAKADLSAQKTLFAGVDKWRGYWFDQYVVPDVAQAYRQLATRPAR